jgi:heptaprenylglyceryl phosphate synthase
MVVDPEVARHDLSNTLERVRTASEMGMEAMLLGGSTDAGSEAQTVIPRIGEAVREVGGNTLLLGFPGTSSQVVGSVDATLSLFLPQLDEVYRSSPRRAELLSGEYIEIVDRSRRLGIPIIPATYIIFNGGRKTTVETITGVNGINVQGGIDTELVMDTITPWLSPHDLVILELGSGPDASVNLGPVAKEVYEKTQVHPIVTGGVNSPELIREIAKHIHTPVGFGTVAENTPPGSFRDLYEGLRRAHPSCHEDQFRKSIRGL